MLSGRMTLVPRWLVGALPCLHSGSLYLCLCRLVSDSNYTLVRADQATREHRDCPAKAILSLFSWTDTVQCNPGVPAAAVWVPGGHV